MSQQYTRIEDNELSHRQDRESLELESLASSSEQDEESKSVSSRGLSPLEGSTPFPGTPPDRRASAHGRSLSVSTLGEHLFNLAASNDIIGSSVLPLEKQKRLNLLHGLGLVIGLQIGSGIFASPSQVNSNAGSVGSALLVWLFAGLLAWTGAASYAELGSAIPLNGSSQAYLNQIFGPFPSFLFAWTALTVLKPGGGAILAIIFGEYFATGLGVPFFTSFWMKKVFALLGLALVTGINCYSTKLGASASNAFFIVKVFMLLAIAIIGIVAMPHFRDVGALNSDIFTGSSLSFGDYAIALYAGLWAYDGWDNMNYVSAEMKNARRDLPRVIHIAMPAVIIAYLLANISYFAILSKEEILSTTTVALTFADKIFGRVGRLIFALLISFSCIGALNATMFGSARLVYSSAEEGFLPSLFSKIHPTRATPVNALLLQAATTAFFVLVGEFQTLLTFYGVAGYIFFFLSVFGVIVLRIREPDLERPYKTWITTPIMFCCVALFLVSRTIFEKPLEAFFALAFIAAGCPIFIYKFGCPFNWDGLLRKLRLKK